MPASLTLSPLTVPVGRYPGAATFPGATVYPDRGPLSLTAATTGTLTLTAAT